MGGNNALIIDNPAVAYGGFKQSLGSIDISGSANVTIVDGTSTPALGGIAAFTLIFTYTT